MRQARFVQLAATILTAAILTACNMGKAPEPTVDVGAISTAAFQTAVAELSLQMTQTAQALPPTPSPTPTSSPTSAPLPTFPVLGTGTPPGVFTPLASPPGPFNTPPGSLCNDSAFIGETIPDGTKMKPGQDFTKTWTLQNTGTCTWDDGYKLAFVAGDDLDGYDVPIKQTKDFVAPGKTHQFSIDMTAHLAAGTYEGCWKMKDDKGYFFGTFVCVKIEVVK